ncbi:MAG: hypothetical protein IMY69_05285 [Bacteroidetes bacterium]|nr:hypothetical protein [Bacteroidota bacterium]
MKKLLILALLAVLVIASCKKDKDDVQQIEPVPQSADYALFNTGSYWIYHWYKIDTLGNETFMDKTDSLYIAEDTIINGHTYQVKKGNFFVTQNYLELCRDSSNYIVSHLGQIMFSATNFTDVLFYDTIADLLTRSFKMDDKDIIISVPAGDFKTYNFKGTIVPLIPDYPWGVRYINYCYAKGVGRVLSTSYYFSSPDYMEQRLIRYHIE